MDHLQQTECLGMDFSNLVKVAQRMVNYEQLNHNMADNVTERTGFPRPMSCHFVSQTITDRGPHGL